MRVTCAAGRGLGTGGAATGRDVRRHGHHGAHAVARLPEAPESSGKLTCVCVDGRPPFGGCALKPLGTSRKHRHLSQQLVFQVRRSVLMQAGRPRTLIMIQPRPDASLNELTPHSRMQRAGIRPGLGVAAQWVSSGRVTQRSAQKREDRKQRGGRTPVRRGAAGRKLKPGLLDSDSPAGPHAGVAVGASLLRCGAPGAPAGVPLGNEVDAMRADRLPCGGAAARGLGNAGAVHLELQLRLHTPPTASMPWS